KPLPLCVDWENSGSSVLLIANHLPTATAAGTTDSGQLGKQVLRLHLTVHVVVTPLRAHLVRVDPGPLCRCVARLILADWYRHLRDAHWFTFSISTMPKWRYWSSVNTAPHPRQRTPSAPFSRTRVRASQHGHGTGSLVSPEFPCVHHSARRWSSISSCAPSAPSRVVTMTPTGSTHASTSVGSSATSTSSARYRIRAACWTR